MVDCLPSMSEVKRKEKRRRRKRKKNFIYSEEL